MKLALNNIKNYLDVYLNYDWEAFNNLKLEEQSQKWKLLKDEFYAYLEKENEKMEFNFEEIYLLIRSYRHKFHNLSIEGKLYITVNNRLLENQLIETVKELEYQRVVKAKNSLCECEILAQFDKEPKSDNLTELGILKDSYYMAKLLECNTCKFLWNRYISDGSDGRIRFKKHNPENDYLVVYHD